MAIDVLPYSSNLYCAIFVVIWLMMTVVGVGVAPTKGHGVFGLKQNGLG